MMLEINCDFHIHSRFSMATSKNMTLENIAKGSKQKGLNLVATGDALHKGWLDEIEELKFEKGIGKLDDMSFILTTEVEDKNRVHHLLFFKDVDSVHSYREAVEKSSKDIDRDGRPHLNLDGREIANYAHKTGALIGPSHAFVPWTSVYKEFDSLFECYGGEKVDFLELGLSADTSIASPIAELEEIPFLSNSDAHSPLPHRLGREFNRLKVHAITFDEIVKALSGVDGREITLNVGFDPRLGKYHRTACSRCYQHFDVEAANKLKWRCPHCSGLIKKGVLDRAGELGRGSGSKRPQYLRIAPLAEIVSKVVGVKSVYSTKVQNVWSALVDNFGSEISVLIDAPMEEIEAIHKDTADVIRLYRADRFKIIEGGGGKYGEIVFDDSKPSEDTLNVKKTILGQKNLDSYCD